MQIQDTTAIPYIEIQHLVVSEHNVRKTASSAASIKALAANLKATNGPVQNRVVTPEEKKGTFAVEAGERRRQALCLLVKSGELPKNHPVPCAVIDGQGATAEEIALAENILREAMHPADEFAAFQSLIDQGMTVKDVAAHFGTTQAVVAKRLKLAGVAPQILTAYRKGELDLDCVMAFTFESDHTRQRAI